MAGGSGAYGSCAVQSLQVVVSRSIPTTTAFEMAEKAGMTVIGRIGSDQPIVYCGSVRIAP